MKTLARSLAHMAEGDEKAGKGEKRGGELGKGKFFQGVLPLSSMNLLGRRIEIPYLVIGMIGVLYTET